MYFPYLRGRQNELLCLRELLEVDRLYSTIIPIIEPVRCNSTFFTTLKKFIEADRKIIIIKNPKVGKFRSDYEELKKKIEDETNEVKKKKLEETLINYKELLNNSHIISGNHLVYRKRGYVGFSDYSIVGDAYEESGFAPLAVAIHILYFGQKSELRVHHFVSESNQNISDPARKFAEAMQNLLSWENFDIIPKTKGLQNLLDYYSNGKFPGLGVIKKCSIMHHLELIGKYLEVDE